jgi:hypothetical protein
MGPTGRLPRERTRQFMLRVGMSNCCQLRLFHDDFLRDSSDELGMQPVNVRNPSNPVHPQISYFQPFKEL